LKYAVFRGLYTISNWQRISSLKKGPGAIIKINVWTCIGDGGGPRYSKRIFGRAMKEGERATVARVWEVYGGYMEDNQDMRAGCIEVRELLKVARELYLDSEACTTYTYQEREDPRCRKWKTETTRQLEVDSRTSLGKGTTFDGVLDDSR
jgi:hypothetical protein